MLWYVLLPRTELCLSWWAQKKAMFGIGVVLTAELFPMLFYGQEMLTYATFQVQIPWKEGEEARSC